MKKLLIWGAGDQGTVTLECALATQQYSHVQMWLRKRNHNTLHCIKR